MEKRISREIEEKEGLLQDIENPVNLKLVQLSHHKSTLVNIKDYGLRYADAEYPVFTGLTFGINKGDRIALIGKNGCGKSTFIKMILQKSGLTGNNISVLENGVCETVSGLKISYVGQAATNLKGDIDTYCKEHDLNKSLYVPYLDSLILNECSF